MTSHQPRPSAPPARRPITGPFGFALLWAGLRLTMLALFLGREHHARGDVAYYFRKLSRMAEVGLDDTMVEYPTPVVWLLEVPRLLGGRDHTAYLVAFMALMLLLDAALTFWLWRRGRSSGSIAAALYWTVFVFLVGPLAYLRFDLVPAVLAAGALLLLARAPAVAGGLVAAGAAIKLWPALLVAGLLGSRERRPAMWWGFAATGAGLVAASVLAAGWPRLFSPLGWQGERGLQIESVWATPTMVNVLAHPGQYVIAMSPYQAYEIFGPGVSTMLVVATAATVLGGLAIIALLVRAWRSPGHGLRAGAAVMTAVVAIMIVTNKTFSPQYLVWLGGPLAVLVLARGREPWWPRERVLLVLGLGLAALTHLVFPLFYSWLTDAGPGLGRTTLTTVLAVRNIGMLAFTLLAFTQAWSMLGACRTEERSAEV